MDTDGLSVTLVQMNPEKQVYQPCSYATRATSVTEKIYAQIECKCIAVVYATEKCHCHAFGNYFEVDSDHEPLQSLLNKPDKKTPVRIEQFRVKLQKFRSSGL